MIDIERMKESNKLREMVHKSFQKQNVENEHEVVEEQQENVDRTTRRTRGGNS